MALLSSTMLMGRKTSGFVASDGGLEVLRSHAEDGEGMAVDQDSLTDDVGRCRRSASSSSRS